MRISDWSSDVCSSDLLGDPRFDVKARTLLATAEASYPFIRTQTQTLRGAFGLDLINQNVRFNALPLTRDHLRVAYARLDLEAFDPHSLGRIRGDSFAGIGRASCGDRVSKDGSSPGG